MFCIYIFREGDALVKDSETLIVKFEILIKFSRFLGKKYQLIIFPWKIIFGPVRENKFMRKFFFIN